MFVRSRDRLKPINVSNQTQAMVKDLLEAEEQYSMSFRSHTKNVDDLIDMQKEQLKKAAHVFEDEVAVIKIEFDKEREFIQKNQQNEMNQLKTIIYGMEKIFLDQENEALADFQGAKEEIKNKVGFFSRKKPDRKLFFEILFL